MSDHTKIEWTDATWNPVTGCSVVSAGCKHCYAMKLAGTRLRNHPSREGLTIDTNAGPVWTGEVRLNEQWLHQPMSWRRSRRIFVCAHGDLFHEDVPYEWIDKVFAVMALSPQHQFQILTKRPKVARDYLTSVTPGRLASRFGAPPGGLFNISKHELDVRLTGLPEGARRHYERKGIADKWPLPNVWLGVSIENQEAADERIPHLLRTPAAVRFLSCEPLLGSIDLCRLAPIVRDYGNEIDTIDSLRGELKTHEAATGKFVGVQSRAGYGIDWVIAGGESGAGARPMHPVWARSLRDQCRAAGTAFFFKQWGDWLPESQIHLNDEAPPHSEDRAVWSGPPIVAGSVCSSMLHVGKKAAGRMLDHCEHSAFPAARSAA